VYEDEKCLAFHDIQPVAAVHVLLSSFSLCDCY
jgi:diadenosine tetraphosphate (Ap4A) HIT family hydrolase